ncbi:MAG: iron ABC transporter permease [Trueperaceae bacterium]|nr:iron ABC transporter permease [Trueperaceae bacterium]
MKLGLKPQAALILGLLALLVVAVLVSLNLGYVRIGPLDAVRTLIGQGTTQHELILFQFRLPRLLLALLVGAGLGLSGAILQAVSRNGLADPGVLGINAGAGLGVTLWLVSFRGIGSAPVGLLPLAALAGGVVAALLVYIVAFKDGGVTPSRLLLVGIAVNAGLAALMLVLSLRLDPQVYNQAQVWLTGSLAGKDWRSVLALLPWTVVLLPLTYARADVLNVLNLGDLSATGLGVGVGGQRLLLIALAVALAASAVSVAGAVGFVGLVAPHLARRLLGPDHRLTLLATPLVGALLVLVADTIARNLFAPIEIPVGVVVAAVGAPVFIYLLVRTRG